jgi:hypothetical protein
MHLASSGLGHRGVHPHGSRDLLVLDVGALAVGGIVAGVVGDLLIFIELILEVAPILHALHGLGHPSIWPHGFWPSILLVQTWWHLLL